MKQDETIANRKVFAPLLRIVFKILKPMSIVFAVSQFLILNELLQTVKELPFFTQIFDKTCHVNVI